MFNTFGNNNNTGFKTNFGTGATGGFNLGAGLNKPAVFGTAATTGNTFGLGQTAVPTFGQPQTNNVFGMANTMGAGLNKPGFATTSTISNNLSGLGGGTGWNTTAKINSPNQGFGLGGGIGGGLVGNTGAFNSFKTAGTTSPLFANNNTTTNAFGNTMGGFGTNNAGGGFTLGQQNTATPLFGAQQANTFSFGGNNQQSSVGTGNPPFAPSLLTENSNKNGATVKLELHLQAITALDAYAGKTFEELRFEDYGKGNKNGGAAMGAGMGGFGKPMFGSVPNATPAFNSAPTTGFGNTGGMFGNISNNFGISQPTANLFGGNGTVNNAFGATAAPAATTGFSFGTQQPNAAFGATNAFGNTANGTLGNTGFGMNKPATGLFGSIPAANTGMSFGLNPTNNAPTTGFPTFGSPSQQQQQAANTGFNFGATNNNAGFSFGNNNTLGQKTNTFGSTFPTATTPSTGFSFGATNATTMPQTTGFSFGNLNASKGFGTATTGATTNMFGSPNTANTAVNGFGGFGGLGQSTFPSFGTNTGTTGVQFPTTSNSMFSNNNNSMFSLPSTQQQPFNLGMSNNTFGMNQQNNQFMLGAATANTIQQQPVKDIGQTLDYLLKKSEDISTSNTPKDQPTNSELPKSTPHLFAGLTGAKSSLTTSGSSFRSTAKIVPRGWRTTQSPAAVKSANRLLMMSVGTPSALNEGRERMNIGTPSVTPENSHMWSNVKKLVISSANTPINDPTADLPPPPSFYSRPNPSITTSTTTPMRKDNDFNLSRQSSVNHEKTFGEATGLTPGSTVNTPYVPPQSKSNMNDINDTPMGGNETTTPRIINFQQTPQPKVKLSNHKNNNDDDLNFTKEYKENGDKDKNELPSLNAPVLTKVGYFACPDISVLQSMTDEELSSVRDFAVFRPNVGTIEWEGLTDVRGLDLDKIVVIDNKEVAVYENVQEPEVGYGLNKPAKVTLYNIFPKQGASLTIQQQYAKKLQQFCEKKDADFIEYDLENGKWTFIVKHFSRYGLDDEDDDEELEVSTEMKQSNDTQINKVMHDKNSQHSDSDRMDDSMDETKQVKFNQSESIQRLRMMLSKGGSNNGNSSLVSQETALRSNNYRINNLFEENQSYQIQSNNSYDNQIFNSQPGDFEYKSSNNTPPIMRRKLSENNISPMPFISMNQSDTRDTRYGAKPHLDNIISKEVMTQVFDMKTHHSFHSTTTSPCMKILMEVKQKIAKQTGLLNQNLSYTKVNVSNNVSSIAATQRGVRNFSLSMGRSFRVGWSADGRLVHSGRLIFGKNDSNFGSHQRVSVERVDTIGWLKQKVSRNDMNKVQNEVISHLELSLHAILKNSFKEFPINHSSSLPFKSHPLAAHNNPPYWRLPSAINHNVDIDGQLTPSDLNEYIPFLKLAKEILTSFEYRNLSSEHPDWNVLKAIELINASFGQEKYQFDHNKPLNQLYEFDIVPMKEERSTYPIELWERRRVAISEWIESVAKSQGEPYNKASVSYNSS
eukprot:gene4128-5882_t